MNYLCAFCLWFYSTSCSSQTQKIMTASQPLWVLQRMQIKAMRPCVLRLRKTRMPRWKGRGMNICYLFCNLIAKIWLANMKALAIIVLLSGSNSSKCIWLYTYLVPHKWDHTTSVLPSLPEINVSYLILCETVEHSSKTVLLLHF